MFLRLFFSVGDAVPYRSPFTCSGIAVVDRSLLLRALIGPLPAMSAREVVKFLSKVGECEHVLGIVR